MTSGFLLPAASLFKREIVRFFRDPGRVVGAFAPPVVFWFLIGSGLGTSFRAPGAPEGSGFLQYFFAGTTVLIVLFTSVFATISVIEDRHEGFLQSVLASPASRTAIVLGKILGAACVGIVQGAIFLAFAKAAGLNPSPSGYAVAFAALVLSSLALTGLGFVLAWWIDSSQGYHGVMSVALIPMWMLSGALFPVSSAPGWLRLVMRLNPVTYGVAAMQNGLGSAGGTGSSAACLSVLAGFCLAAVLVSERLVSRSA